MTTLDTNNEFSFFTNDNNIKVIIRPRFHVLKSKIMREEYVWVYDVEIENNTDYIIEMLGIDLQVFSKNGLKKNITFSNVINQRPVIEPNMTLYYTDQIGLCCSNSGLVRGVYYAVDLSNIIELEIEIPPFSLDTTSAQNIVN